MTARQPVEPEERMNMIDEMETTDLAWPEGTVAASIILSADAHVSLLTREDRKEIDLVGLTEDDLRKVQAACQQTLARLSKSAVSEQSPVVARRGA